MPSNQPPIVQPSNTFSPSLRNNTGRSSAAMVVDNNYEERISALENNDDNRIAALEKTIVKLLKDLEVQRLINPKHVGKNSALARILRETYKSIGEEWDTSISIQQSEKNRRIFAAIEHDAFQTSYFKEHMLNPVYTTKYKTTLLQRNAHQVIRNHYEYLQRLAKHAALPQEEKVKNTLRQKYYSRLNRKYKRRVNMFKALEEGTMAEFGAKEECEAVLKRCYMSDEEDDEVVRENVAHTMTRLVPVWRSEKLNQFYEKLDELNDERMVQDIMRKRRSFRSVDIALSNANRAKLPSWSIKSGY